MDNAKDTRSIFIESREWFDKSGGNSYFSSRLWVNGQLVDIMPSEYGYDTQHIHRGIERLIELGYLYPEYDSVFRIRANGVDFYTVKSEVLKRDMFTAE